MIIKFLFCETSLPGTSRCVLIDISNLTHILCCNLLVMSCLTPSAISANVLENAYSSLAFTLILTVNPSQMPCNRLRQRFSRMFSKLAWATLRYYFCEVCYPFFPPLWATAWRSVAFLANFANLLKTCVAFKRTRPPWFLTTKYYDIFIVCLGTGHLSQGERRGKEKN